MHMLFCEGWDASGGRVACQLNQWKINLQGVRQLAVDVNDSAAAHRGCRQCSPRAASSRGCPPR